MDIEDLEIFVGVLLHFMVILGVASAIFPAVQPFFIGTVIAFFVILFILFVAHESGDGNWR